MPATQYAIPAPATTAPVAEVRRFKDAHSAGWTVNRLVVHGIVIEPERLMEGRAVLELVAAAINRAAKGAK